VNHVLARSPRRPRAPSALAPLARLARLAPLAPALLLLLAPARPAHAEAAPTFADRPDEAVRDADRAVCVLLHPLAMAVGVYGAEADVTLGGATALAVEGHVLARGGPAASVVGLGLLLYPRGALRGPYLEPRAVYARPLDGAAPRVDFSADVLGAGATAGWQWTWDYGPSVRVGGGAMYFFGGASPVATGPLAAGPQLVLDAAFGWAF